MAADCLLIRLRHWYNTGLGDSITLKTLVHSETKDNRVASSKAGFDVVGILLDTLVLESQVVECALVAFLWGLLSCRITCRPGKGGWIRGSSCC